MSYNVQSVNNSETVCTTGGFFFLKPIKPVFRTDLSVLHSVDVCSFVRSPIFIVTIIPWGEIFAPWAWFLVIKWPCTK